MTNLLVFAEARRTLARLKPENVASSEPIIEPAGLIPMFDIDEMVNRDVDFGPFQSLEDWDRFFERNAAAIVDPCHTR
jgi:hypothetical protein